MANVHVDERFRLRVRNLPAMLSMDTITSLLSHYGAVRVRVLQRRIAPSSGKEPGSKQPKKLQKAIATFLTKEAQQIAQKRLHLLELAGHRLLVEPFGDEAADTSNKSEQKAGTTESTGVQSGQPSLPEGLPMPGLPPPAPLLKAHYTPAPLAPHLGLNYAPSPLLAYKYPKATESIVCNIANALIALPRFYTQVLHLMNKMNLPPPFTKDAIPGRFSVKQNTSYENDTGRTRQCKRCKTETSLNTQIVEEDEDSCDSATENITGAMETQSPLPKPYSPTKAAKHTIDHQPPLQRKDSLVALTIKSSTHVNKLLSRKNAKINAALLLPEFKSEGFKGMQRPTHPGLALQNEGNRERITPEDSVKESPIRFHARGTPSSRIIVKNVACGVDEKDLRSVLSSKLPLDVMLDSIKITLLPAQNAAEIDFSDQEVAKAAIDELHGVQVKEKTLIAMFHITMEDVLIPSVTRWTLEECTRKRFSDAQLAVDKAMKNYQRGEPSNSLYVKNLAKTIEVADLYAVFGAALPLEFELETLHIRHFTQGRLKCQAFVTYPTVDIASSALLHVHGVVLKGKPIIVSFRNHQKAPE